MGPWLYIVLLGACVLVYAWLRPNRDSASRTAYIGEIETTLEEFARELEEDNRKLMEATTGIRNQLETEIMRLGGRVDALEKQLLALAQQSSARAAAPAAVPGAGTEHDGQSAAGPKAAADMKNRYPELFRFHDQGKSIEYIAKKIGMNKGEVQLIIQLAKQEEEFRVE